MATIVNNPSDADTSGTGVVVGIVIALLVLILFFVFGLPYLRNNQTPQAPSTGSPNSTDINVTVPPSSSNSGSTGGTGSSGSGVGGTLNP